METQVIFRNIFDYIFPINDLSKVSREEYQEVSVYRIVCPKFKQDLNQLYNFDQNYGLQEEYFKQVSHDRNISFELSHRFDLLLDLTRKAWAQGRRNLVERGRRWNKMVYRIHNYKHCPLCNTLVHPETDYCDHCRSRIYINCLMCTIRVYQKNKDENNRLCDDCRLHYR